MKQSKLYVFIVSCCLLFSCSKEVLQTPEEKIQTTDEKTIDAKPSSNIAALSYTTYLIAKGQHYCNLRPLKFVALTEMKFSAKFNQSAIYKTVNPVNQYDINKLWGFSEGIDNQYNSVRIGWGYSNGAIRLYGYVHCKGARYSKEITTVLPGQDVGCSIKVYGNTYIISAKGVTVKLPRGTTATTASGLQQYPYFGGDEVAPQDVTIFVKPL